MRKIIALLVIVCVSAIAFTAGCADSSDGTPTTVPTTQPVQTTTQQGPIVTEVTQTLPTQKYIEIDVRKDQIYNTIIVEFRGGKGQSAVTKIDVKATLSNGEVEQANLDNKVGDTVEFNGTSSEDRVEVWVSFTDGTRYKIYDDTVVGKTRN
jgi:hypothetical protein